MNFKRLNNDKAIIYVRQGDTTNLIQVNKERRIKKRRENSIFTLSAIKP